MSKERPWNIRSQIFMMLFVILFVVLYLEGTILYSSVKKNQRMIQTELDALSLQTKYKIEKYLSDIEKVATILIGSPQIQNYLVSPDSANRYHSARNVYDVMHSVIRGKSNIDSVHIIQSDYGIKVAGPRNYGQMFYKMNYEYNLLDMQPVNSMYTRVYLQNTAYPMVGYLYPFYPVDLVTNQRYSEKNMIVVSVLLDDLQEIIAATSSYRVDGIEVSIEEAGNVILSNQLNHIGTPISPTDQKTNTITTHRALDSLSWTIHATVQKQQILAYTLTELQETIFISVISVIVILSLGIWVSQRLTKPVVKLAKDISETDNDLSQAKLLGRYKLKEVDTVSVYINRLLYKIYLENDKLLASQRMVLQSELATKEAELAFYQTQINPHFLYNTLGCISSMAYLGDGDSVATMSDAMANIFRYSIKDKETVYLVEELNIAQEYFKIIQIRFEGRYRLEEIVEDSVKKANVPKMIIQPLLENSISHGLAPQKSQGLIIMKAFVCEDILNIEVEDNGVGIPPDTLLYLERLTKKENTFEFQDNITPQSIGILNIHKRIQLKYGVNYGLTIQSNQSTGTRIIIRLPFQE